METKEQLEAKKAEITERLNKIEKDLKSPMEADLSEQSLQLENRQTLESLRKVEMENLKSIEEKLASL